MEQKDIKEIIQREVLMAELAEKLFVVGNLAPEMKMKFDLMQKTTKSLKNFKKRV